MIEFFMYYGMLISLIQVTRQVYGSKTSGDTNHATLPLNIPN